MNAISIIFPIYDETADIPYLVASVEYAIQEVNRNNFRIVDYEIIFITSKANKNLLQQHDHALRAKVKRYSEGTMLNEAGLFQKGFFHAAYADVAYVDPHFPNLHMTLSQLFTTKEQSNDVVAAFSLQKELKKGAIIFSKNIWEVIHFFPGMEEHFISEFFRRAVEAGFIGKRFEFGVQKEEKGIAKIFAGIRKMRLNPKKIHPQFIPPTDRRSMVNAGYGYKKQKYTTHTMLTPTESAVESFIRRQVFIFALIAGVIILGLAVRPLLFFQIFVAVLSFGYMSDVIFNVYLVLKIIRRSSEVTTTQEELDALQEKDLPIYSILCPLFKEAHILPQFLDGIAKLDWPKEKLDVCLLLESNDFETLLAVERMHLPPFVRVIVVPHSFPKTKPKACNYGLAYTKGEYLVIFDAEDIPDPLQLKKAYVGFQKSDKSVVCLQAKLNYYNTNQNLLTRFFTAEYSLWFDVTLEGLHAINTSIPLGGTSNHFRAGDLKKLNAWDPFNVTEDADLGIRLFKHGYRTAILDSVTLEEANSRLGNWLRQRSRWIKGYMQTYLVHTRQIVPFIQARGIHAFIFHLVIGGKLAFIFINPLLWTLTLSYFILPAVFGPLIETFYPTPVLYIAISSLIFGNSLYLFNYIIGCVKKEQWSLIKYIYLIPFYWLLISIAGYMAFYQLLFKPHYWEKTVHGLHLQKNEQNENRTTVASLWKFTRALLSL